jgi:hypothetical protein
MLSASIGYIKFEYLRLGEGCVFNAPFNTISAISWILVLLMEETGVPYFSITWSRSYVVRSHFKL